MLIGDVVRFLIIIPVFYWASIRRYIFLFGNIVYLATNKGVKNDRRGKNKILG